MKHVVLVTITILLVVAGMLALWQMAEAVQLLLLSLAVAASLAPNIQQLSRRGYSRSLSIGLSFLLVFGLLLAFVVLFLVLSYGEVAQALTDVPAWYSATRTGLAAQPGWRGTIGQNLPPIVSLVQSSGSGGATSAFAWLAWTVQSVLSALILIFAVLSLAFYWLVDESRITRLWLSFLPLHIRVPARAMWDQVYREVGLYLRGEGVTVILSTIILLCVYSITGLPGAATLALIGGVAMVLPVLGVPLALVPGALVALTRSYETFGLTLALALVSLLIIKRVIGPHLFRDALKVNPVLQVIVILSLAKLTGIAFILFAPPLAAAIQAGTHIWITEFRHLLQRSRASQVTEIKRQLSQLEARIDLQPEHSEQYQALLTRARRIVNETAEKLPQEEPTTPSTGLAATERGRLPA